MTAVLVVAIIAAALLFGWHMWLAFHFGVPYSTACACGHAAAFHKDRGGCKHINYKDGDCYGYCTCQRSVSEVEGRLEQAQ